MNPKDSRFANRLKMFPSLTKSCTINWISQWSESAFFEVAKNKLSEQRGEIAEVMKNIHKCAERNSIDSKKKRGEDNYININSYHEFIKTYKRLIIDKDGIK